ncbi:hypothetical protein E4O00_04725 [Treponema sp. OMZ 788]|uniref:hypothetical protein n=1 Tax=Treponema sp. OMZ 788 TaxID=2563664 RepID=UPI0020A30964|nr:hypothetical protein [Treponema sp. OMZ 788]UTC65428.1 hypothetical protein E4O00_04725 [Treponema sp. OMZ 788]
MSEIYKIGFYDNYPLALDGWLKWNEDKWNIKAERVLYTKNGKEYPRLEGVLYTNKKGQVLMPPRNPYLPFQFSDSTNKNDRLYVDYQDVMNLFVDDLLNRGLCGTIALPPGFTDARPFQWSDFIVEPRYTFFQYFSLNYNVSPKITNKINKAIRLEYFVECSTDWSAIVDCLLGTEVIKGFSHNTSVQDLKKCADLLGNDVFRGYLVKDKDGKPVSGGLRLVLKDGITIDWSQGAIRDHLKNGVNQLIYDFVLQDSKKAGAIGFDWVGANIAPVALAKSAWGMPLVPYLCIRPKNLRYLGSVCKSYLKSKFLGN